MICYVNCGGMKKRESNPSANNELFNSKEKRQYDSESQDPLSTENDAE